MPSGKGTIVEGDHLPQGLMSMVTIDLAAGLGPLDSFFFLYSARRSSRILAASSSSSSSSLPKRSTSSSASGFSAGLTVTSLASGP